MAFCNKCGTQMNESVKFCTKCGNPVAKTQPPDTVCSVCGTEFAPGDKFCPNCGQALGGVANTPPPQSQQANPAPAAPQGAYQNTAGGQVSPPSQQPQTRQKKSGVKKTIIEFIWVIALTVIGLIIFVIVDGL